MSRQLFGYGIASLALAAFALTGDAVSAQGKKNNSTVNPNLKAAYHTVIGELRSAHKYLEIANHDYQGHRAKAAYEVHQAIRQLEKHHHHHFKNPAGTNVVYPHPAHHKRIQNITEPQLISNEQLKIAAVIIQTAGQQLSTLPQDNHTVQAEKDLAAALNQIQMALAVAPKS